MTITHRLYKYNDPTYYTWVRMRSRCLSKRDKDYENWGGRGITICKEWTEYAVFLKEMGMKPSKKHSLGRIDNDKGYSKENCRWETQLQQHNNKRSSSFLEFDGRKQTKAQWAREFGMNRDTLGWRLKLGWSISEALTEKVRIYKNENNN